MFYSSIRKVDFHLAVLLCMGIAFFIIKCIVTYPIKYVGHADAAAYAEMADSLIHGRGFSVDYISWYFEKYDPKIVRPEDHWPPLYSILIAPFFPIFGKTAFAAKLPSLIISCLLLPVVIYYLTKEISGSKFAGLAAGAGILLYPFFFRWSLHCLSDILFTFVVCSAVLFAVKSLDNPLYFYFLGVFMGLAYYAKGSGLVIIPGFALFYLIAYKSIKKVIMDRRIWISFLIAFLVLLPWFIRNYIHFRDPLYSTQRFAAGYIGYQSWETGTYGLYWGERPPPSYFDKFKEIPVFQTEIKLGEEIDDKIRQEFKNHGISLSEEASLSVKRDKWLLEDDIIYTIRREDGLLNVYKGGLVHVIDMTKEYLEAYFWWTFIDIYSQWGKYSSIAFLTYFINIPSLLGLFLLWGNPKRHIVWITTLLLILFLSAGWSPINRLAMPMISLMMSLGWSTYFVVIKFLASLTGKIPFRKVNIRKFIRSVNKRDILEKDINKTLMVLSKTFYFVKNKLSVDIIAGFVLCCLAMPVIVISTENVDAAIRKSGYPYREGAQEWMDMGRWLRENATPDSITMTRNPWELHFYSEQPAIQIPRTTLEKTIEVMRYYKPNFIIPQLDIRPSLKSLVEGKVPGLELVYDNKKLKLYKIRYDLLP
ncbi:hypothetical protein GF312_04285 [Candidatus Poribacteria bacterium]|nr:hypothetical protein [Candidatus Poribacteria bacterium]